MNNFKYSCWYTKETVSTENQSVTGSNLPAGFFMVPSRTHQNNKLSENRTQRPKVVISKLKDKGIVFSRLYTHFRRQLKGVYLFVCLCFVLNFCFCQAFGCNRTYKSRDQYQGHF